MKHRISHSSKYTVGFALPTILIASVVMITVLLAAVQATVSIRMALYNQYYERVGRTAAESGTIMAEACLSQTDGIPADAWNNSTNMLRPDTDCSGDTVTGQSPYIYEDDNMRVSFTVRRPNVDSSGKATVIAGTGRVELLRQSSGQLFDVKRSEYISQAIVPYVDDSFPVATSTNGYWSAPPPGYLLEDGSAVSRTTYAALFAVIGTTYGAGDGSTTFNLPDSRGRATISRNPSDSSFNVVGMKLGTKTETLTIAQMPSHAHDQYVCANTGSPGIRRDYKADGTGWGLYAQGITTEAAGGGGAHNNIQPSIAKVSAIKFSPPPSNVSKLPAGTSISGYWSSAPTGYLAEDGSAVSRSAYSALYGVVGTTYGAGNGSTTFNLPDSRGRVSVNRNASDTEFASIGQKYGTRDETLTVAQIPSHAHNQRVTANTGGPAVRTDHSADGACSAFYQGIENGPTGGGGAHNNVQPSIVKMSVIKQTAPNDVNNATTVRAGASIVSYAPTMPANSVTTPPASGYLIEDGTAVSRTAYAALFATIGTTYGAGNGSTTFNLPDSRGRVSVARNPGDTEFSTIGQKYGSKTHTLQLSELPSHTHDQYVVHNNSAGTAIRRDYTATAAGAIFSQGITTGFRGGGGAHNEIQPSIVAWHLIKF